MPRCGHVLIYLIKITKRQPWTMGTYTYLCKVKLIKTMNISREHFLDPRTYYSLFYLINKIGAKRIAIVEIRSNVKTIVYRKIIWGQPLICLSHLPTTAKVGNRISMLYYHKNRSLLQTGSGFDSFHYDILTLAENRFVFLLHKQTKINKVAAKTQCKTIWN